MSFASCLYAGRVFHRRARPKTHVLQYRVFSLLLDLSELDTLDSRLRFFSHNRFNLFSFHDKDFGDGRHRHLQAFARARLEQAGIRVRLERLLLSCYPRILGYIFNPLSVFYCLDSDERCFAIIHEVHNTFGERHWYVLPVRQAEMRAQNEQWIHQSTQKQLFVSPFAHMNMHYRFRLNEPRDKQIIVIRACDEQGTLLTASYVAQRRALTDSRLLGYAFVYPMMGLKVIIGIHWEALRLWCKRIPWFRHRPLETGRDGQAE